jgi:gamma-glutamyltranspeptidase / glutathione hydrolase
MIPNRVTFWLRLGERAAAARSCPATASCAGGPTNSPTSLAEPAFYQSALRRELTREFGEKFTLATGPILPLDHHPGDAIGLQVLGPGLHQAVAEPVRLGGGSALAINPGR